MKKVIGCLLAICLLIQFPSNALTTYASVVSEQVTEIESEGGIFEVQLKSLYDFARGTKFAVTLEKKDREVHRTESITLQEIPGEAYVLGTARMENLSSGLYTVTVSGSRYGTYQQDEIEITDGIISRIELYTAYEDVEFASLEGIHPGVIPLGNVNQDDVIDHADVKELISQMDAEGSGLSADLNRDGRVDLMDLQYLSDKLGRSGQEASVLSRISLKKVEVETNETEIIQGEVKDLFTGEENSVALKPAKNEAISESNPVEIGLNIGEDDADAVEMEGLVVKSPVGENEIQAATITVTDEKGQIHEIPVQGAGTSKAPSAVGTIGLPGILLTSAAGAGASGSATMDEHGNITVDLGGRIAVKKITIRVTATKGNSNLAEISKVEFLNDMQDRIPEPQLSIPTDLKGVPGNKSFVLSWNPEVNVTGYEIEITYQGTAWSIITDTNTMNVTAFNGEELLNLEPYQVRVRSVNGEWRSPYCEGIEVIPQPSGKPAPPDNVMAEGGLRSITVSWKKMKDTTDYMLYYQELDAPDTLVKLEHIKGTSYKIEDLKDMATYTVWVAGWNSLGEGGGSLKSNVTTTSVGPVIFPQYRMINVPVDDEKPAVTAHIKNAFYNTSDTRAKSMKGSTLDTVKGSALGMVDNDFASYYYLDDWDDGCHYQAANKGITVEFDQNYEMDMIMLADVVDNVTYTGAAVFYLDGGVEKAATVSSIYTKKDQNGRRYHVIKLSDPVDTNQMRICLKRYGNGVGIAELRFYQYDSIEHDIMDLYADDLHLVLKENVNEETIADLRKRLNTPDSETGEYHPEKDLMEVELDNAEAILKDAGALKNAGVVRINPNITAANDGHLGFGGLNSWQPLGITAYAGEELVIYVGHNSLKTGAATKLELVATQYHAESSPLSQVVQTLKIGRNVVTIPAIPTFEEERGGSLYVQYKGNDVNDQYGVRVAGGQSIPVLNLYQVEPDSEQWNASLETYVKELQEQAENQQALHNSVHAGTGITTVDRAYDEKNCILGATEIMLNQMMLSVSGRQILAGLSGSTVSEKAGQLSDSLKAMEEMMTLFYHHKGLNKGEGVDARDLLPQQHLNIRYQRMFAGAFMYASGDHIGIEWDSVKGLAGGKPIVSDNGKYVSGNYFGWGIAHEIGHDINQGTYAIAEVTNNYFSVLAQAKETNESVRFSYDNVYDKVTSGTTGRAANVFTQLGLYWQLHLAYDEGYNYKVYDTYQEQFDHLFFARVDTYARTPGRAPVGNGNKALTLTKDIDQNLMRLASAAAEKDLTEFFERWGMTPDAETRAYVSQFEKEERAIYYENDEARVYALEHAGSRDAETVKDQAVISHIDLSVNEAIPNQITLTLSNQAQTPGAVLGYEITRCSTSGGAEEKKVIGFTRENTFTDTISSINNRVFTYEVTVIDKFLNRSQPFRLEPVKVSHDGSYDKTYWTATTNMTSDADVKGKGTEEDPCDPEPESAVSKVIDKDSQTVYTGTAAEADPEIILELKETLGVTALKYTAPAENRIGSYTIFVRKEGGDWIQAAQGTFQSTEGTEVVYFRKEGNGNWASTFDADYVKIVADGRQGTAVSVGELELLGPTGDNVEFLTTMDAASAFGYLSADYPYDENGNVIPAGSLVFVGEYKGNPAYNAVILYDEQGNIVGGIDESTGELTASQIILADVPEDGGKLGDTWDGRFIYWIEPDDFHNGFTPPAMVRAELYRVDNALTNEGQRLVSDTKLVKLPDTLANITLSGSGAE